MLMIAVFPNLMKPETREILRRILHFFSARDARVMMPRERAVEFDMPDCGVDDIERIPADFALSLGGDGTLLGICRRYAENPVPVCGINMGTLGFMIGPPAEREYAVEPVGDATMKPSALHSSSGVSLTASPSAMMRATSPFITTMSLMA